MVLLLVVIYVALRVLAVEPFPCFTGSIMKTWLYDFDPLKPHFYIVKLRFTGVYIIFLISAQNIDCGTHSNEYSQSMLCAEI